MGILIGFGCDISEPEPKVFEGLDPVEIHDLQVPEPSGLTLNTSNTALYTVSDPGDNRVYKLSLEGDILDILSYHGDDLEGIAYDDRDHTLWVAEERLREIVHLDTLGNELSRHSVDFPGNANNGFEGLCLMPDGRFFVLNEMDPVAILELSPQLELINTFESNIALDISGICYVESRAEFIIVSDMSKTVMVLDDNLELIQSIEVEHNSFEGIEFDADLERLYLVNDSNTELSIFNLIEE